MYIYIYIYIYRGYTMSTVLYQIGQVYVAVAVLPERSVVRFM